MHHEVPVTRAVLGLGANLGSPREALRAAVAGLAAEPGIALLAVSGLWRTAQVGGPEQPDYLNAVVVVETDLPAPALLAVAHQLEQSAGRTRDERWGPRSLDVDLLDVAGVRSVDPGLTLPHPRAHLRAFVLAPWAQVDPGWALAPHDVPARPVRDWLADLAGQQVEPVDEGAWWQ